jgi:hypothetical protein
MPLRKLVLLAPLVFVVHVLEEAPGFVAWFNRLVPRGITQGTFLAVNVTGLVTTVVLVVLVAASRDPVSGLGLAAWVGFLFLANGFLHLVGTIAHARYSPGVVTGTLLYLPYGTLLLRSIARDIALERRVVLAAAGLGSVPMLVHGYLIVFRGSRLF